MSLFFKRLLSVLALTIFITISPKAQSITQTVRGKIVDQESNTPLPGANVVVIESDPMLGSVTDPDGNFRIDNVALTSTRAFTVEDAKRYAGSFNGPARMVSGYAPDEMTRDSDLSKNTLKVSNTLNHKFNAQHNLQTGYLKSDPPTLQKNLFTKDISLKSVAFRRAVIDPVLFIATGLSTLADDNDDNYEVQE